MSTVEFNQMLVCNTDFLKPFAFKLTRDMEIANDLYQDTLYRALHNKDKYQVGTNMKAWLYTIMRNIFINNYRRKAKQRLIFNNSTTEYKMINSATTVNKAVISLNMKEIYNSLNKLPEIFKSPFLLYYEGYKYNEISEMINEPLGTVKSRIHFARKLLKAEIER